MFIPYPKAIAKATAVPAGSKASELRPSNKSAFKLVTFVVDDTTIGAVPVETVDVNCGELKVLPLKVKLEESCNTPPDPA